jgi:hypothetical protein
MATRSFPQVAYDGRLMAEDAAVKGLDAKDLAARSGGELSLRTVYRFLSNDVQTPRTARILARLIGRPVGRYVIRSGSRAVA